MVSTGAPQWRGTNDQWLAKRLNQVPVVIGDFDASLLWFSIPWFEVPPTPAFLGVGPIGFWLPLAFLRAQGSFLHQKNLLIPHLFYFQK